MEKEREVSMEGRLFQKCVIWEKLECWDSLEEQGLCTSLEKDEDLVLVLEKETNFKIGKLESGNLRHLRKKRMFNNSKKYIEDGPTTRK